MQYQLKAERISLAQVFSKMEQVVEVLAIEDYSVSQTTLDNVSVGGGPPGPPLARLTSTYAFPSRFLSTLPRSRAITWSSRRLRPQEPVRPPCSASLTC